MSTSTRTPARLTSAQQLMLDALCDEFEAQLEQGTAPPIAQVIVGTSGIFRAALTRELLAVELEHRAAQGEPPTPDEYRDLEAILPEEVAQLVARFCPRAMDRRQDRRIAHFELLEPLGKGAFGTVWKALDTRLGRPVALKIAHANLVDDPERFLREARATAQLQHPNIVRILDVGQAQGQLYLVREFIEGRSLAEVRREQPFSPRQVADLGCQLADALAHSHALGCIHRDIKPENILLDGNGTPHLLDFGLAKCALPNTPPTLTGDIVGTPAYMAPEQARGDSRQADARTDVYSLGVVLYELLTGERPFRGTLEMVIVQILHEDPPHPLRLRRDIPTDLATICLKCLEKDPSRRYPSAGTLADDLRRFLAGSPIQARPVSILERAWRWAGKHRAIATLTLSVVGLATLLLVGLLVASVLLKAGWDNERALHVQAEQAARDARTEAEVSAQVTAFLESVFAPSDPIGMLLAGNALTTSGTDTRQLVRRAADRIDRELADQPRVQARLMDTLGNVLRSLGAFADAERLLTRAAEIRSPLLTDNAAPELRAEIARNRFYQGWLRQAQGRYFDANSLYQQALDEYRTHQGAENLSVAEVEFHLGWLHLERRRSDEARRHFTRSLELRTRHLPSQHPLLLYTRMGLAQCDGGIQNLAGLAALVEQVLGPEQVGQVLALVARVQLARRTGDHDTARRGYQDLLERISASFPGDHPVKALVLGDHAGYLWDLGEYPAAEKNILEALRQGRQFAPHHPRLLQALIFFAHETLHAGRWHEAEKLYREALAFPELPDHRRATITHGLIWACLQTGQRDQALAFAEETVKLSAGGPLAFSAWSRHCLARILSTMDRTEEAAPLDAEALRLAREASTTPQSPLFLSRLATIFTNAGEGEAAEKLLRQALAQEEKQRPADHPRVADHLHSLGSYLLRLDRLEEAAPFLRRALTIREKRLPTDDPRLAESRKQVQRVESIP